MRQLIIARKDLNLSPGKLAAQVSHASLSFLSSIICNNTTRIIKNRYPTKNDAMQNGMMGRFGKIEREGERQRYCRDDLDKLCEEAYKKGEDYFYVRLSDPSDLCSEIIPCEPEYGYQAKFLIDPDIYEQWLNGIFTKTVCEAKNKAKLMKAVEYAKELGLEENKDFFLIKDACLTELEPEEIDENGKGFTLTCIGFRPLPDELAHKISHHYQLYH